MLYKITINDTDDKWIVEFVGEDGSSTTKTFDTHKEMMDYLSTIVNNMSPEQKKINDYSEDNS
jgi:hypothetical protein